MPFPFADKSLQERHRLSRKIKEKYPECVPILIDIPSRVAYRKKYIVGRESPLSRLILSIRDENNLAVEEGIYLMSNNTLLMPSRFIEQIYKSHANEDGFLYITVMVENTFGNSN
jgi:hypothetical protein